MLGDKVVPVTQVPPIPPTAHHPKEHRRDCQSGTQEARAAQTWLEGRGRPGAS